MKKFDFMGLEGQIDLLSLLMSLEVPKKTVKKLSGAPEAEETEKVDKAEKGVIPEEDYLKKGERLMSLAREKYKLSEKIYSKFEENFFQCKFKGTNPNLAEMVNDLAKKVIRPILRAEEAFSPDGDVMRFFQKYIDHPIRIGREVSGDHPAACYLRYRGKKSRDILELVVEDEKNPMTVYGYRCETHAGSYRDCFLKRTGVQIADIAKVLAWLMVFGIYNKTISDEEQYEAINAVTEERLERWKKGTYAEFFHPLLGGLYEDTFGRSWMRHQELLPKTLDEFRERYEEKPVGFVVPFFEYYRTDGYDFLGLVSGMFPADILSPEESDELWLRNKNRALINSSVVFAKPSPIKWIIGRHFESAVIKTYFMESVKSGVARKDYLRYMSPYRERINYDSRKGIWARFCTPIGDEEGYIPIDDLHYFIESVVKLSFETEQNGIRTAQLYNNINREHAKSYQTKRGIPQYILEEMKNSQFNDCFGYVEIDEDCDVEKVKVIAEQFNLFKKQYLRTFDFSSVSLRFRKLGNHKASGLYYPHINCLCVDFRTPSSFIHEVGHCIDHLLGDRGDLSQKGDFYGVYYRYKELLYMKMWDNEGGCKERLSGNTKYNMEYYLTPTEVFARCWEIYITRVLGLDFTLCKQDEEDSFAYPRDKELEEYVKYYFDRLSEERINKTPPEIREVA